MSWRCALELDQRRNVTGGSAAELAGAIGRGADLRIYTEFIHNQHIDVTSANAELVREVAEFGVTYRVENWAAGIMSLRQPIELPHGFGPRPSMSFFLYNQDGTQAIARPYLDGRPVAGERGPSDPAGPDGMPLYHVIDRWDAGTNAPCENFVYDFDVFRYCVNEPWREVLRHTATGEVVSGSLEALVEAFSTGCDLKVGIAGLCDELADAAAPAHEVFVQGGPAYYYTEQRVLILGTHPVVRLQPSVPMRYRSGNWDFGWLMLRTDGHAVYRRCDPHTLAFSDHAMRLGVRWFVR